MRAKSKALDVPVVAAIIGLCLLCSPAFAVHGSTGDLDVSAIETTLDNLRDLKKTLSQIRKDSESVADAINSGLDVHMLSPNARGSAVLPALPNASGSLRTPTTTNRSVLSARLDVLNNHLSLAQRDENAVQLLNQNEDLTLRWARVRHQTDSLLGHVSNLQAMSANTPINRGLMIRNVIHIYDLSSMLKRDVDHIYQVQKKSLLRGE